MNLYETIFIGRQDITASAVEELTKHFGELISKDGGKVQKTEDWGLRTLAYKINKNRKGHYVLMHIEAEAATIHECERQLRLNEDILRYITVRVDEFEEGPSAIIKDSKDSE
ncbi:MAG: 30S ribosomal protein S6 [Alphaproteobacteria bacterium]|nr:30S ribosomal protein S6 [Alphaproteobacteria bacterium]